MAQLWALASTIGFLFGTHKDARGHAKIDPYRGFTRKGYLSRGWTQSTARIRVSPALQVVQTGDGTPSKSRSFTVLSCLPGLVRETAGCFQPAVIDWFPSLGFLCALCVLCGCSDLSWRAWRFNFLFYLASWRLGGSIPYLVFLRVLCVLRVCTVVPGFRLIPHLAASCIPMKLWSQKPGSELSFSASYTASGSLSARLSKCRACTAP